MPVFEQKLFGAFASAGERRLDALRQRAPQLVGAGVLGFAAERELLRPLRENADLVVDTSTVAVPQLRATVERAFGTEAAPQSLAIAEDLGIDPVELRLRNIVRKGDTSLHGWRIDSSALPECLAEVSTLSGFRRRGYTPASLRLFAFEHSETADRPRRLRGERREVGVRTSGFRARLPHQVVAGAGFSLIQEVLVRSSGLPYARPRSTGVAILRSHRTGRGCGTCSTEPDHPDRHAKD